MEKARNQAEQYARSLPASGGRPPFLLIVDVCYSIELFAEFTCTGGTYVRFPDPRASPIYLADGIEKAQPVTAPGIPAGYPNPQSRVTEDCVRPAVVLLLWRRSNPQKKRV